MAYTRQQGFESRLLRRVQRHRAMTTLFRSPVEPVLPTDPAPDSTPAQSVDMPVVQATLALPEVTQAEAMPLVAPQEMPVWTPAPRPAPQIRQAPIIPPQPITAPAASAAQASVQASVQRQATPEVPPTSPQVGPAIAEPGAPVSAIQEDEESGISEKDWSRLTTIFRKHKEKIAAEEAAEAVQPPAPPEPVAPKSRPERGITELPSPVKTQPTPEQAPVQITEAMAQDSPGHAPETIAVEPPITEVVTTPEAAPTVQRTVEAEALVPEASSAEPIIESDTETETVSPGEPVIPAVPASLMREPVQTPEDPTLSPEQEESPEETTEQAQADITPSQVSPAKVEAVTPVTAPIAERAAPPVQRSEAEITTAEDDAEITAPPLEQALAADSAFGFQVTRKPTAPAVQRQAEQPEPPTVKRLPPAPQFVKDEDHRDLHLALDKVEAGKPTDSSIEVIPPRRPRPETHMHLQRTPGRPPAPPTARQPQDTPVALRVAEAETPSTVPTPIGPLPSDLWTLIGAEVPQAAQTLGATQPMTRSRTRSAPPQVQASMPSKPSIQRTIAQTEAVQRSPVVQRDVALDQVETQVTEQQAQTPAQAPRDDTAQAPTSSTQAPESTAPVEEQSQTPAASADESQVEQEVAPSETPAASETDLDILALQVYQRIKRKLSIEWERLRSKY